MQHVPTVHTNSKRPDGNDNLGNSTGIPLGTSARTRTRTRRGSVVGLGFPYLGVYPWVLLVTVGVSESEGRDKGRHNTRNCVCCSVEGDG